MIGPHLLEYPVRAVLPRAGVIEYPNYPPATLDLDRAGENFSHKHRSHLSAGRAAQAHAASNGGKSAQSAAASDN